MSLFPQQARVPFVMVDINGVKVPGYITQPWYQFLARDIPSSVGQTIVDTTGLAAAFLADASDGGSDLLQIGQKGDKGEDGQTTIVGFLGDQDGGEPAPFFPSQAAMIPVIDSGKYTPTLTNVANLDASTAYECQWLRVGNTVTISGKVDVDPTLAATATQLGISLPVASNFGAAEDAAGTAYCPTIAAQGAAVMADAANNMLQMQWVSGDVTNQPMYFTATYEVI